MRPWTTAATRFGSISFVALIVMAGLIAFSASVSAREDPVPPVTGSALDEVERYVEARLSEEGVPGLAAAIVYDGEIVSTLELGEAGPGAPMRSDTPLFIASLSKSITAIALMQQVETGRVDLDDPVSVYLPELAPEGDLVTVRDLLHHRSGLTTYAGNEAWSGELGSTLEVNVSRLGPLLEAGASYRYSNANYDALALIVQRVAGTPFGEYLANEVFAPLEMDDSFVGPPGPRREVATGHSHWMFLGYRPVEQPSPRGIVGSASMFSTAEDLAHLVVAHLRDGAYMGKRVLSSDSLEQLHAAESFGVDLPEDYPVDAGYAGGLVVDASFGPDVDEDLARMVTLWHDGSTLGFRAMVWMMPEVGLGLVALTNGHNSADESWLPQVAQGVKYLLFGLDPPDIEVGSPFLLRFGKHLLLALVAAQIGLAGLTIRRFRRHGRRWLDNAVFTLASIGDLAALVVILWVIPNTGEAPLGVVLQEPDYRILVLAMSLGVLWGAYRTYVLVQKRPRLGIDATG